MSRSELSRLGRQHLTTAFCLTLIGVIASLQTPVRAAVSLSAVAPLGASAGVTVQITGTGFSPTANRNQVTLSVAGVSRVAVGASIVVVNPSTGLRRLAIVVPSGLPVGTAAIQVRNLDTGEIGSGRSIDIVQLTVSPSVSAARGASGVPVRMVGSPNTLFVAGRTSLVIGAGVSVTATQVLSATELVATVSVTATAALGARTITVASSSQTAQIAVGFSVIDAPPPNRAPVAVAGPDQTLTVRSVVQLNGSASTDPDGNPLTFAWAFASRPAGSTASLANPTAVNPTFVIDVPGAYDVDLVVSDATLQSPSDRVTISTINSPPVANAGADTTAFVLDTVTLNGGASSDVDGDPLTYAWSILDAPAGSSATLSQTTVVSPTLVIDVAGAYLLQLIVNDGHVDSLADTMTITTLNSPPVANAGADLLPVVGTTVQLDGSSSTDIDGQPLTFHWSLTVVPPGSAAVLSDPLAVKPTFDVDLAGSYVAQLVVNDGSLDSLPDTVNIGTQNRAPIANPGQAQSVAVGSTVQLDGSASTDPDGNAITFRWSLSSAPSGSGAVLSDTTSPTPTFVADLFGDYVAQLIVNDGSLDSAPQTVTISTNNSVPIANAGPDQTVATGVTVQLDGSASSDPDGTPLQTSWSLTTRPAGSNAALSDASIVNPTFVADVDGTYLAQLIVGDGVLLSTPDTVTISSAPGADLAISFYAAGSSPIIGGETGWGIAVSNLGPASTTDVRVRAAFPAGYTFTAKLVPVGSYDETTGIWTIGPMASGGNASIAIYGTVNPTGPYDRTATVIESSAPDPNPANNTGTQIVTPDGNADLQLSFFFAADTPPVDSLQTWGLQVHNLGPAVATVARIQAPLPAGYTFVSANMTAGTSYDVATGIWTISPPATTNGSALSITYTVNTTGPYDLVASIIESDRPDPNPANNARTVIVTPNANADLQLSFFAAADTPPVGSIQTWGLQVHNNGPAVATVARIHAPLPAGYTFVSANMSTGTSYDVATGIWTISPPATTNGSSIGITYTVNATGPYDLVASIVESNRPDSNLANNTRTQIVAPNANADLGFSFFSFNPGLQPPGSQVWMILQVPNAGPASASNVAVDFKIPTGFSIFSVSTTPGTYDQTTGVWTIGDLSGFATASMSIVVTVNPTGPINLVAIATSSSPDPNPANNTFVVPRINRPPVANAGVDQSASTYALVNLDGSGSFDADGDPITFAWSYALRPINSASTLSAPTAAATSFTPDLPGNYVPQLIVADSFGVPSAPDLATVSAIVTNSPPTIVTAPVTAGAVAQPYAYDVHATDPDINDLLTFSLTTAPSGMTIDSISGLISWVPGANQGGQQSVSVRVQDGGGLFGTQSFVVQVGSPGNGQPAAVDDTYEARVGESLSVGVPGVVANDSDENALSARLVTPPGNGTALLNADGSFTYTPHTLQPGEFVLAENVNLAARIPGVTVTRAYVLCPRCAIDEDLTTKWDAFGGPIEIVFPAAVTVSQVKIAASRNPNEPKISAGIFELLDGNGATLYDSGPVEILGPVFDATLNVPSVPGVRRVRFTPTASPTSLFSSTLAELKVIGSALIRREPFVEPNLVQLLPATVTASSEFIGNVKESLTDDSEASNWFSNGNAGDFIEVTFPIDTTVTQLRALNPSGRPDGFGTSLGIECSGTFVFLDASRNVLFSSGLVNEPFGSLHPGDFFTLDVPNLTGVRHIRYTVSGCIGNFPAGFAEWRVIGSADVPTPAFGLGEKFQSLQGREAHSTPIVVNLTDDNGDGAINADDIPDIIVPVEAIGDQLSGEIKAISGDDGRELFTAGGPNLVSPWSELAAADIDGDGMPEIIAVHSDGSHLIAFEHTGVQKWISDANPMPSFNIGAVVYTGAISIANLDGAGPPEIIVGASVFDADGHLLGDGRTLSGTTGGVGLRSAISAVGDIDLDGVPELVGGPTAYRLTAGSLSKLWQRTDRPDGYVGIANLDDDPQAEIVSVANGVVYVLNHDGSDQQDWNAPTHTPVAIPGGGQGGAPLIVDVDGDGRPEIGVAGASHFVLFNRDGSIRWMSAISDRTSNSTGAVAFDLNGDGEVEIIYRDEFFLRIYRGADGVLLAKTLVGSATWAEEPVVADVDNDGHADIIVSSDFFRQSLDDTGIIVFQDVANKWKRTRRIWNQHSYHVTNVNEDATIPLNESAHWLIPGLNAFRTNAFVPGESAEETDSFTYVASDGVLDSNVASVRIAIRTPNSGPQIASTPITSAADGVTYSYAAQAIDPDAGDILTFSLPTAPTGMSIDAQSGLIQWVPTAGQQGSHSVIVKVEDVRGLSALQGYQITVASPLTVPDIVGQLQAAAENAIAAAGLAVGAVTSRHSAATPQGAVISQNPVAGAPAAASSPVSFALSLGAPPAGTVPNVVGLTQTSAQQDVAAAGFTSGATGQSNSVVAAGIVLSQNPVGGTVAPSSTVVSLVVSLGPPPGELDLDLDGFTGNQGDCNDTNAAINPFAFDTPGDGIDQNCNGVDSIVGDATFPVALIESPAEDTEISMPTDIVGTATDANFLRYRLLVASVEDDVFTQIAQGTSPATSGVLGRFDPTLRENGMYRVRLVVEDVNGQTTVDERVHRVTGTAKVGVFSLSFVDLQAPFSGIPITVVRTYDSRVKAQRDFGIGWSLQVKTGTYQNNRRPGDGWTITTAAGPLGLPCTVVSEMRTHVTEIRLSEREFYIFRPKLTGLAAVVGGCVGTFTYEFVKSPFGDATLQVIGGRDFIYTSGDVLTHFDGGADTGLIFNPLRVRLTTADKRVIDLESRAGITRIQDSNDNTLDIGSAGIVHSSGRSIAFTRDALGRIVRITDLRGFPLLYAYDGRGDLIEFTDQTSSTTTFTYDATHLLLEIHDAQGNRAVRNEYDADGRLLAVTDAKGIRTEFDHDLGARSEVVRDGLGHETQVVYDDLGNLRSTVKTVTIDGVAVPATTQYDYDANGNETVIVDADHRRIENAWDSLGNQLSLAIDPAGLNLRRQFTYTASGALLTETDPNGDVQRFTVDARTGNPTSWMDVDGRSTAVQYDKSGNVTRTTDPNGRATQVSYDTGGRPLSRTDALGHTTTYTYDSGGNKLTETTTRTVDGVLRQLTTRFEYDAKNRLTRTVDPLGRSTQMAYDSLGRRASMTDVVGRTTTYEYNAIGDLVKTSYPDGTTELRQYDDRGDVTQVTNREGLVTRHEYDELRRLVKTTLPTGAVARYVYSAGGRQLATIAPDGARTDYEYDAAGRRILKRGPAVPNGPSGPTRPEWRYEYDAGDRLVAETDPLGRRREMVFDTATRRVTGRLPDGTEASEIRDQWSRPIRRVDQEGRAIDFSYVADTGWLSSVTLPPPAAGQHPVSWQFEYDEAGKRTSQIDPLGRKTRFAYDEVGRLRHITLPGGEMRRLTYDGADRIAALTDYDGQTTTFEYDLADRVTRKSLPTGGDVRLTYTPGGQRATAQDARGITSYAYDTTGRLIRIDQPTTGSIEYDYDIASRVTSIKTTGATTSYSYDALSRLVGVQGSNGTTAYQYDLTGNLTRLDMPDGIVATLAHDVRNQLTSLSYQRGGTTLGTFGYSYTPAGRRATITEAGATTNLTYDQIGRLIGETRTGTSAFARQFEYDLAGNRTRTITNGLDVSSTYDTNDRLLTSGTVAYAYDPRGNVISRNQAGAVSTFAWTSDNRLASVTNVNGTTLFTYDADGTRVAKSSAAGTIRYLVDGINPTGLRQALEERDDGGGLLASHQFGLGLLSTSRSGVDQYALADGQTNIRMLADATGQVTDQYSFDAFGNPVSSSGSTNNDHRYIGEALDAETGLYYLRERYYDPTTGRFLSRDPVEGDPMSPLSLHRYLYAGNDPANFADPNGDFFTLIGFSVNTIVQGFNRGFELSKDASSLCKVKGIARIIPVAVRLREFTSTLGKLEDFIERLTPTFGVGSGSTPFALSFKEMLYEHPLAKVEPPALNGELRAVELAVSPTALDQFAIELTGVEFRNSSIKMAVTCGVAPFRFISFSGTVGKEVPLFEMRVCGVLSMGTISGVVNVTAATNGTNFSGSSVEVAAKLAVQFLPELAITIIKFPE